MNAAQKSDEASSPPKSLLVVGAGVLGRRIAAQYWEEKVGLVTCETRTETSHPDILNELPFLEPWDSSRPDPKGCVRTKAQGLKSWDIYLKFGPQNFDNVVFCAPPSGNDDYTQEVKDALRMWNRRGRFVFTSSSAVYGDTLTEVVTEGSALKDPSEAPRARKLLEAEAAVQRIGGTVVRLSGLYHETRGAHAYFLKLGTSPSFGGGVVNQIHYDDAASLCVAALLKGAKGQVFLGCDNEPRTRAEIAACAAEAEGRPLPGCVFQGEPPEGSEGRGRAMNNDWTREQLSWTPRYASFDACMAAFSSSSASACEGEGEAASGSASSTGTPKQQELRGGF